jgi:hypothetical protein
MYIPTELPSFPMVNSFTSEANLEMVRHLPKGIRDKRKR